MAVTSPGYSESSGGLFRSAYTAAVCLWVGQREAYNPFTMTELAEDTGIKVPNVSKSLGYLIELPIPMIARLPDNPDARAKPYYRTDHPAWPPFTEFLSVFLSKDIDWSSIDVDWKNDQE